MARRTVSVEASCSFEFEIDDAAVSEHDGVKILEVLQVRGQGKDNAYYTEQATMDGLLGHLGIELSVENRRMSSIDGWADFSDEAASGHPYGVQWSIESVDVSPAGGAG